MSVELVSILVIVIWLTILTFFLFRTVSHYNKLSKGVDKRDLRSILENILKEIEVSTKDIETLKARCDKIDKDGNFHIQKIGLLRFNPFKDTGGDQSFILALVDGNDTGVVISGLYSRSGTRWYAKKVIEGKSKEHELSEEEKKAVKEARLLGK